MNKTQLENSTVKPELEFTEGEELYRVISFETESELDTKLESVTSFIENKDNSGFTTEGEGLSDTELDNLYIHPQSLLVDFKKLLRDAKFNFHMNRPQYKVLTNLLKTKIEYDINSLFIALELVEMLDDMFGSKFKNDEELIGYTVTATEITYVYHLLAQYKVKGITNEAKVFSQILIRIGEISKVVSYYDTSGNNLTGSITEWAAKFPINDLNLGNDIVESTVIEPTVG